ncbi:uncharacterized protein LOC125193121 [Salvia hispanica]|uniref:uncharacterized protein LOC125193121 n=1 Tax=Salvia hispanica TaxID=49212 RepID=UPI0020090CF2|nr:uncharacterized protein LOC125193121 [Salvia hispanica]
MTYFYGAERVTIMNKFQIVRYLVGIEVLKQETRNGMGKTAVQILNESPPNTYEYSHMKCMLTEEEKFSFFEAIPEMSSNIMVVAVLIATMAFQAMISPPGGVWAEDDANSSRKAGEAVMAFYHPKLYRSIVRTNLMAFLCSLLTITMFLFHAVVQPHYLHVMVSMFGMGGALIAIFVTFTVSLTTISPDEVMRSTGNKIMGVAMFGLLALWVCFLVVRRLYLFWLKKKSRQQDLTVDAFPLRVFYWIFDKLETRGYLRAAGRFQVL